MALTMRATNPPETLIFVHIAKTAGSTFNHLMERHFFLENSFGAYENNMDPSFRSITGVFEPATVFDFVRENELARGAPFGFLPGHMRFGLHAHLDRPSTYVTFVRDPVARVASAYAYVQSLGWLDSNVGLMSFVEMDFLGNSDAMVRQLVNDASLDSKNSPTVHDAREVTESDLARALWNLEHHFAVAAPVEGFDQALLLLALHFGWPLSKLFYEPVNVGLNQGSTTVTKEVRERILERNCWDAQLYQNVVMRFTSDVKTLKAKAPVAVTQFIDTMAAYRKLVSQKRSNEASDALAEAFRQEADNIQRDLAAALFA